MRRCAPLAPLASRLSVGSPLTSHRLVAGNRYRLFGRRETCRLPTESDAARLLP